MKRTKKILAILMLIAIAASNITVAPSTASALTTEDEAKITKVENVRQTNATTTSADISWNAYNAAPVNEDKLQESNYYYEVHIAYSRNC